MNPPAPGPVSGLSATQEARGAATQASTALPALGEHTRAGLGREGMAGCNRSLHASSVTLPLSRS
jgi:hypothetical protein